MNPNQNVYSTLPQTMGQPAVVLQPQPAQVAAPKKKEYRSSMGEKCGVRSAVAIVILVVLIVVGFPMMIAGIVVYFVSSQTTGMALMITVAALTAAAVTAVVLICCGVCGNFGATDPNAVKPEDASSGPPPYDQSVVQQQPVIVQMQPQGGAYPPGYAQQPAVMYVPSASGGHLVSPQQPGVYEAAAMGIQPGMNPGQPNPGLYPSLPERQEK